ncbi:hypothetical protein D9O40_00615 [Clostridium autoethanogenum]|uniref:Uncharacterized protein n=2 Tax=Clostridium autoethanogenum TaxID=84023 RepID=A0A3M0TCB9_9CLOT|nr:hypothetical protein D9O40_00615 [Clostridium autoethanogenum]
MIMNKQKMLKMLMDDLKSMSDEELIKSYEESGIAVTEYKPGSKGQVCLYDYDNGVISGDVRFSDTCSLISVKDLNCFEIGEGVA